MHEIRKVILLFTKEVLVAMESGPGSTESVTEQKRARLILPDDAKKSLEF